MKRKNLNATYRRTLRRNFIKHVEMVVAAAPHLRMGFATNATMTKPAWDRIRKIQELGTVSATPV